MFDHLVCDIALIVFQKNVCCRQSKPCTEKLSARRSMMKTIPEFTIQEFLKKPDADYANFEGENRVFIIFKTISPKMVKLRVGDMFGYRGEIYQIKMKTPRVINRRKNIEFNCLKMPKSETLCECNAGKALNFHSTGSVLNIVKQNKI